MHSPSKKILENLNPSQREAVETIEGPLLIIAGAGSGKTRVVTHRIANLIENGVRPWQILAITFTNKAATEVRTRVENLVGASGVWLSTFHSFCARLLRLEAQALGLSRDYSIYDESDVKKLLDGIIQEMATDDKRFAVRNIRPLISRLKAQGVKPEEMEGTSFNTRVIQQIYTRYKADLQKNQALDFDDLLLHGLELLKNHSDIRERYQDRFRYILIDEYQDTNHCQYELVKLLGQAHQNVCATGDPDQSIYSWRGADIQNILSFERDFQKARTVRLEQNYRSTKKILAVAAAVIKNNSERKEKDLWTENPEGEDVKLVIVDDQEMEAHEVASRIDRIVRKGRSYSDIAVFYRTNAQSRPFETALINAAIPYQIVGGTPFYERKEVKDALSYLRLIVNPQDDIAFRRIINEPKRSLGPAAVEKIAQQAGKAGLSMLACLDQPGWMEKEFKPKSRKQMFAFAQLMDRLRALPSYPVAPIVRHVLEDTGLKEALDTEEDMERIENLEQLLNAATVYDGDNPEGEERPEENAPETKGLLSHRASLSGFLENASLVQSTDDISDDHDRVTLMTLHMAKGLEFPFAFMVGMEQGLLPMEHRPSTMATLGFQETEEEQDNLEEERRLFYVGVTRAREQLTLTRAKIRMRYGSSDFAVPSQFLHEIPEEYLTIKDRSEGSWRESSFPSYSKESRNRRGVKFSDLPAFLKSSGTLEKNKQGRFTQTVKDDFPPDDPDPFPQDDFSQVDEPPFEIGDQVQHPKFGTGTVLGFSGMGLSSKVKVRFGRVGTKLLLLSMAKLEKL